MKICKILTVAAMALILMFPTTVFAGSQFISVQEEPVWDDEFNRWCILRTTRTNDTDTDTYSVKQELICL